MTTKKKETDVSNDARIAVLENTNTHLVESLSRIELALTNFQNRVENKFTLLDSKVDCGFKEINNRFWTNFFWKIGAFAAILAIMAHGFKWI